MIETIYSFIFNFFSKSINLRHTIVSCSPPRRIREFIFYFFTIKSNVGKSVLGGLLFVWVNIFRSKRVLSHLEQLLLSELGIVINV